MKKRKKVSSIKKYLVKSSLRNHVATIHSNVIHNCDICGRVYSRRSCLIEHINSLDFGIRVASQSLQSFRDSAHGSPSLLDSEPSMQDFETQVFFQSSQHSQIYILQSHNGHIPGCVEVKAYVNLNF